MGNLELRKLILIFLHLDLLLPKKTQKHSNTALLNIFMVRCHCIMVKSEGSYCSPLSEDCRRSDVCDVIGSAGLTKARVTKYSASTSLTNVYPRLSINMIFNIVKWTPELYSHALFFNY